MTAAAPSSASAAATSAAERGASGAGGAAALPNPKPSAAAAALTCARSAATSALAARSAAFSALAATAPASTSSRPRLTARRAGSCSISPRHSGHVAASPRAAVAASQLRRHSRWKLWPHGAVVGSSRTLLQTEHSSADAGGAAIGAEAQRGRAKTANACVRDDRERCARTEHKPCPSFCAKPAFPLASSGALSSRRLGGARGRRGAGSDRSHFLQIHVLCRASDENG